MAWAGGGAAATVFAARWPGVAAAAERAAGATGLATLAPAEAADLAAIAAQIIPDDETPGAGSAGVIGFFDAAFAGFMAGDLAATRDGLAALNADVAARHGPAVRFAHLDTETARHRLTEIEDSAFFERLRFMTIAGFLAMPVYGGNRDHAGWRLIGFDHRHSWKPPFGHYDAHENDRDESDPAHTADDD